jgi:hypothetical protein
MPKRALEWFGKPSNALCAVLRRGQAEQGLSNRSGRLEARPEKRTLVDAGSVEEEPSPRPVLDNDYEIRPCRPDPQEDPAENQAEAEREAELDFQPD